MTQLSPVRTIEYEPLAERNFYRNTKTGESSWAMPPAIKFYIPTKLEAKVDRRTVPSYADDDLILHDMNEPSC